MGNEVQIPNSNPWIKPDQINYFQLSDLNLNKADQLRKALESGPSGFSSDHDSVKITLTLRRALPKHLAAALEQSKFETVYTSEELLALSYQDQIEYISKLTDDDLISLYGASDHDINAVKAFLQSHKASQINTDKERRTISFSMLKDDFTDVFWRDDLKYYKDDGDDKYVSVNGLDQSYLTASGDGADQFAEALIAFEFDTDDGEPGSGSKLVKHKAAGVEGSFESDSIYPSLIGQAYGFSKSHQQVTDDNRPVVGLLGSGGNETMLAMQDNPDYMKYFRDQGIDPNIIPRYEPLKPDDKDGNDTGEQTMDLSVISSIAPHAKIIATGNDDIFSGYADLIYRRDLGVDVISSSVGLGPTSSNIARQVEELGIDALLRGIPVVVTAGDQGVFNGEGDVLPTGTAYAGFADANSTLLSIGGTAFAPVELDPTRVSQQKLWNQLPSSKNFFNANADVDSYFNGLFGKEGLDPKTAKYNTGNFSLSDFVGRDLVEIPDLIGGEPSNSIGSSGSWDLSSPVLKAGYQRQHLGDEWSDKSRVYPDISVLAGKNLEANWNSDYLIFDGKKLDSSGGTSAGAPLIAGLLANAATELKTKHGPGALLGFINPLLYEIYDSDERDELFIDVPSGSNNANLYEIAQSPEEWIGNYYTYLSDTTTGQLIILPLNGTLPNGLLDTSLSSTGPGFDAATGLGSVNGENLVDQILEVYSNL